MKTQKNGIRPTTRRLSDAELEAVTGGGGVLRDKTILCPIGSLTVYDSGSVTYNPPTNLPPGGPVNTNGTEFNNDIR